MYISVCWESYWQTMVNLATTWLGKLQATLTSPNDDPWLRLIHPTQLGRPQFWGGNSHLFLLTGHHEWGHGSQQWSVPFRWSPWQQLQTECEGERKTESAGPWLCAVCLPTRVLHFSSLHVNVYSASIQRRAVYSKNCHIMAVKGWRLVSVCYTASQMLCFYIHLHKAWRCQIKQTPGQAATKGRSMFKSATLREYVDVLKMHLECAPVISNTQPHKDIPNQC